jgi:hypothetical protein
MLAGDTGGGQPVTRAATEGIDLELELGPDAPPALTPEEMESLDLTSIVPEPAEEPGVGATAEAPDPGIMAASNEATPPPSGNAADDELDFSDLAGILGEPENAAVRPETGEAAPGFDLIFDDAAPSGAAAAQGSAPETSQDDLLLDLESLLEDGERDDSAADESPSGSTDELDLDFAGDAKHESSSELEIEPVDEASDIPAPHEQPAAVSAEAQAGLAAVAGGVAALVGRGKPAPSGIEVAPHIAAELDMSGATGILETEPEPTPVASKVKPRSQAQSGGLRKVLVGAVAAMVLLLLALGVPRTLGVYVPILSDTDLPFLSELEVPGLGKVFEPVYDDPAGTLKLSPVAESVTAEFVDHPAVGRLCVVRGVLKNNYDHARNYLQVTSKLFNKNREVTKTATVFAGNVLTSQELAAVDLGAINARLKNRNGTANQNVGVKPGAAVPFMVVFNGLPENLEEYSVEAAGSSRN